jgi:inner membrane protein
MARLGARSGPSTIWLENGRVEQFIGMSILRAGGGRQGKEKKNFQIWDFRKVDCGHLGAVEWLMHAALGAVTGDWLLGRRLGNRALAWGAFFGVLPGLEVFVAGFFDTARELAAERGASHSLLVMALGSWGIAQALVKLWRRENITTRQAGGFVFGVWAAHVAVDCFSVKGAALFWPVSQTRLAFAFLDSRDWLFALPMVVAVMIRVIQREPAVKKTRGKSVAPAASHRRRYVGWLCASALYALTCLGLKFWVTAGFQADLARRGLVPQRQTQSPAGASPLFWRAVVDHGDQFRVGYRSVFELPSSPVRWTVYPKGEAALAKVAGLREVKTIMAVTDGWWLARPHAKGAWVGDLRPPEFRTWGCKKGMVDSRLVDSWVIDIDSQADRLRRGYVEDAATTEYLKRMLARVVGKRESWEANPRLAGVAGSLPEFLYAED